MEKKVIFLFYLVLFRGKKSKKKIKDKKFFIKMKNVKSII